MSVSRRTWTLALAAVLATVTSCGANDVRQSDANPVAAPTSAPVASTTTTLPTIQTTVPTTTIITTTTTVPVVPPAATAAPETAPAATEPPTAPAEGPSASSAPSPFPEIPQPQWRLQYEGDPVPVTAPIDFTFAWPQDCAVIYHETSRDDTSQVDMTYRVRLQQDPDSLRLVTDLVSIDNPEPVPDNVLAAHLTLRPDLRISNEGYYEGPLDVPSSLADFRIVAGPVGDRAVAAVTPDDVDLVGDHSATSSWQPWVEQWVTFGYTDGSEYSYTTPLANGDGKFETNGRYPDGTLHMRDTEQFRDRSFLALIDVMEIEDPSFDLPDTVTGGWADYEYEVLLDPATMRPSAVSIYERTLIIFENQPPSDTLRHWTGWFEWAAGCQ